MTKRGALILHMLTRHGLDIAFVAILLFAMFAMGIYAAQSDVVAGSRLLEGSSVNGIDLSEMDPDQALEKVVKQEEERLLEAVRLVLVIKGQEYVYGAHDLGAKTDALEVVSAIIGDTGKDSLTKRTQAYYLLRDGVQCDVSVSFDAAYIEALCLDVAARFYEKPVDASLRLSESGDSFDYIADRNGSSIDSMALYRSVMASLAQGVVGRVQVQVESTSAGTPLNMLTDNTMPLSTFDTAIGSDEDLLRLSELIEPLNGYVIPGYGSISLRDVLYPAGGIPREGEAAASQIASTLYDALLLAGVDKTERHPNNRPPEYVEMGLDAALDDTRNLVMQNNTRFPIYILAGVREGELHMEVHGRLMRVEETIQLRTGSVRSIKPEFPLFFDDATLPEGKQKLVRKGMEGYRVSSYRSVLRGGVVVSDELLSMDVYPPVQEVYHRGTLR